VFPVMEIDIREVWHLAPSLHTLLIAFPECLLEIVARIIPASRKAAEDGFGLAPGEGPFLHQSAASILNRLPQRKTKGKKSVTRIMPLACACQGE
jgi:hypothetical protein